MLVIQMSLDWVIVVLAGNTKALDRYTLLMDRVTIVLASDGEALD